MSPFLVLVLHLLGPVLPRGRLALLLGGAALCLCGYLVGRAGAGRAKKQDEALRAALAAERRKAHEARREAEAELGRLRAALGRAEAQAKEAARRRAEGGEGEAEGETRRAELAERERAALETAVLEQAAEAERQRAALAAAVREQAAEGDRQRAALEVTIAALREQAAEGERQRAELEATIASLREERARAVAALGEDRRQAAQGRAEARRATRSAPPPPPTPVLTADRDGAPAPTGLRGAAVLCVLGDEASLGRLTGLLGRWGLRVRAARDGFRGLELLREAHAAGRPFQGVILDAEVPGLDGTSLGRLIRDDAGLGPLPLVLLQGERAPAEEAIFSAVLRKPVAPADLAACLQGLLSPASA